MSIETLDPDVTSLCWKCRYFDWAITFPPPAWENICNSPGEYTPGDDVQSCLGFTEVKND